MLLPHQLISSFCTRFSHYHLLFGGLGIAKMSQARTICYVKHTCIDWNCLVWPLQQQTFVTLRVMLWHTVSFGELGRRSPSPGEWQGFRRCPALPSGMRSHRATWWCLQLPLACSLVQKPQHLHCQHNLRWGTCTGGPGGF